MHYFLCMLCYLYLETKQNRIYPLNRVILRGLIFTFSRAKLVKFQVNQVFYFFKNPK